MEKSIQAQRTECAKVLQWDRTYVVPFTNRKASVGWGTEPGEPWYGIYFYEYRSATKSF